jgi:hypothetical protein
LFESQGADAFHQMGSRRAEAIACLNLKGLTHFIKWGVGGLLASIPKDGL